MSRSSRKAAKQKAAQKTTQKGERKAKAKAKEEKEEEGQEEEFVRITNERTTTSGKRQLEVEWRDGERSWLDRKLLKGQAALEEWDNQEPEEPEILCCQQELDEKVAQLAQWILAAEGGSEPRYIVFHVGAGMSAGDGVPTFRGVGGLWTRGREDITNFDLTQVQPGFPYRAMAALEKNGFVDWTVTQNYDGLFRK